jgi:hypothetical protein
MSSEAQQVVQEHPVPGNISHWQEASDVRVYL